MASSSSFSRRVPQGSLYTVTEYKFTIRSRSHSYFCYLDIDKYPRVTRATARLGMVSYFAGDRAPFLGGFERVWAVWAQWSPMVPNDQPPNDQSLSVRAGTWSLLLGYLFKHRQVPVPIPLRHFEGTERNGWR